MLTTQEKNLRKELKGVLRDMGGFVHSKKPTDIDPGMTMVCEPTISRDNAKFYNVSFAWCASRWISQLGSHPPEPRRLGEPLVAQAFAG